MTATVDLTRDQDAAVEPAGRDGLLAEVERLAGPVQSWDDEARSCDADADRTEQDAPGRVLRDGSSTDAIASEVDRLRKRAGLARRAAAEARELLVAARRDVAGFDAGELDGPLEEARAQVREFEEKRARLLAALEQHTGASWRQVTADTLIDEARAAGRWGEQIQVPAPADWGLRQLVLRLEAAQRLLRAASAGERLADEDLAVVPADEVPEVLRPGGVCPQGQVRGPDPARDWAAETARAEEALEAAEQRLGALIGARDSDDASRVWALERGGVSLYEQIRAARLARDEAQADVHTARGRARAAGVRV